jgi:hypothetical protein
MVLTICFFVSIFLFWGIVTSFFKENCFHINYDEYMYKAKLSDENLKLEFMTTKSPIKHPKADELPHVNQSLHSSNTEFSNKIQIIEVKSKQEKNQEDFQRLNESDLSPKKLLKMINISDQTDRHLNHLFPSGQISLQEQIQQEKEENKYNSKNNKILATDIGVNNKIG